MISGKKILLGITGGIAAYKSAELLRLLQQVGGDVSVVMTSGARQFVTPLTFQALSGRQVYSDLFEAGHTSAMEHIELARWPDLILIAPATASFMSRLRSGLSNDLLSTLCLATKSPIAIAPAMNHQMWSHPATQENLQVLRGRGVLVWGPDIGDQACGESGPGRMMEPADLVERVSGYFAAGPLAGKKVVMTAGPTREPIDPVRFIGNRSSGKMGYALAAAMAALGAEVILVSGPVDLPIPSGVERISVETALEMHAASLEQAADCDIFIGVAAVADYRPSQMASYKIKKGASALNIELTLNPDILAEVAQQNQRPYVVGFAAETEQVEQYARQKLRDKRLDMIIANTVGDARGGFESDENAVMLIDAQHVEEFPLSGKVQLAHKLAHRIAESYRTSGAMITSSQ